VCIVAQSFHQLVPDGLHFWAKHNAGRGCPRLVKQAPEWQAFCQCFAPKHCACSCCEQGANPSSPAAPVSCRRRCQAGAASSALHECLVLSFCSQMHHRTRASRVRTPDSTIALRACLELFQEAVIILLWRSTCSPALHSLSHASDRVAYEWVEALGWEQRPNEDGTVRSNPICSLDQRTTSRRNPARMKDLKDSRGVVRNQHVRALWCLLLHLRLSVF
jgi:hypothetical protein